MRNINLNKITSVSLIPSVPAINAGNPNNLLILTTTNNSDNSEFTRHLSSDSVSTSYGTNSEVARMSRSIFSQSPNIISGGGQLIVAPLLDSVSATSGNFVSIDLSSNLASLLAVSNGSVNVQINGVDNILTGLDFTLANDIEGIALILNNRLNDAIVTASNNILTITSKLTGTSSTIDLVADSTGTSIITNSLLNATSGTTTDGTDSTGETILEAINRVEELVDFRGAMTDLVIEESSLLNLSTSLASKNTIFFHQFITRSSIGGVITDIKNASNNKFRCLWYSTNNSDANSFKSAYVSRALSVDFNGVGTSNSIHLKILNGILSDPAIDNNLLDLLSGAGADVYTSLVGRGVIFASGTNEFLDNVYNDLWLQNEIQIASVNVLATNNSKIAQTEEGISAFTDAYIEVLQRGTNANVIGTGLEWTGNDTIGNPEDLRRNITEVGYYIYHLPITEQTEEARASRAAPTVQIAVKYAGAVHSNRILINRES